jgi:hypothetical protein
MGRGLHARADQREAARVRARERLRGHGGHRGRANRGDRPRLDRGHDRSEFALEQHDHALMRIAALRGVAGDDAEHLCAEPRVRRFAAGHAHHGRHQQQPFIVIADSKRRPHRDRRASLRECDERFSHHVDALANGQHSPDVFR